LLYTHGFPLTTLFIRTMIGGQKQEGIDIIIVQILINVVKIGYINMINLVAKYNII